MGSFIGTAAAASMLVSQASMYSNHASTAGPADRPLVSSNASQQPPPYLRVCAAVQHQQ